MFHENIIIIHTGHYTLIASAWNGDCMIIITVVVMVMMVSTNILTGHIGVFTKVSMCLQKF